MSRKKGLGEEVESYKALRRMVGVLGVTLPVVVAFWGWKTYCVQEASISQYYALEEPRNIFVGYLFAIGSFLFAYHGPERLDDLLGSFAGVMAFCVALLPATNPRTEGWHLGCAAVLFVILAVFSLWLFTKSDGRPTERKLARNRVYRVCGYLMLLCLAAILVTRISGWPATILGFHAVFALETLILWAFGVSWFVKGDTILRDRAVDVGQEAPALGAV